MASIGLNPTTDTTNAMQAWTQKAFLGIEAKAEYNEPTMEVLQHTNGTLHFGKSVMNTPLCLAGKKYTHGLGTHSVSEVEIQLTKPGARFEAIVGIDDNYDTQGKKGSVEFVVEVAGKELFRSGVRKGSDPAMPVSVELGNAKTFTLKVLDGGDGPSYDQCDWVNAKITQNEKSVWLDEVKLIQKPVLGTEIPFSLVADGKPVTEWTREVGQARTTGNITKQAITFTNKELNLQATANLIQYKGFPVIDWTLHLKNTGTGPSPMITELRPLDLKLNLPAGAATLHGINGSTCSADDFIPYALDIPAGYNHEFAPNGGRSSDGVAPFFNMEWQGGGVLTAIGWSGQWAMNLERDNGGGHLRVGQQTTHFRLNPGEEVRTPRIILLGWEGKDRMKAHNLFRKLAIEHIAPKVDGKPAVPPISENTFATYSSGNDVTEENQIKAIKHMASIGVEAFWLDAGWFKGGWPAGAGNWDPKPEAFPRGLRPLGDAAHKEGMKFILWFEPERVTRTSPIFKDHPEWVIQDGGGDCLFNLGIPEARKWLTDSFSGKFKEWGVDVYRNDFNIDPLRFWTRNDTPDRQGISEIRYLEGLYRMWDDFLAGKPGLTIDNCASGGRRIDIEMMSRSYPLWQSDYQCFEDSPIEKDQDETQGLNLYVPLHSAGVWTFDPYKWRSIVHLGVSICQDPYAAAFDKVQARKMIAEAKRLRPLFLGDFYPLMAQPKDTTVWSAWQFDRPDLGEGLVMIFRRGESPFLSAEVSLKAIDPKETYSVEFVDEGKTKTLKGKDLQSFVVRIAKKAQSVLIVYKKKA